MSHSFRSSANSLADEGPGSRAGQQAKREELRRYIELKRIADGLAPVAVEDAARQGDAATQLLYSLSERLHALGDSSCAADQRIERFLAAYLGSVAPSSALRLPSQTLVLDRPGMARELSLPAERDTFSNSLVDSYRVRNGVLHNTRTDRRTTQGTFHVTEGWMAVPADKVAVPRATFALLLEQAWRAPRELALLPFTADDAQPIHTFVSLLIRPLVVPLVRGCVEERRMEVRFFAPAGLISNLDFVETIFGNGGDPYLPENDAALHVAHWTGHTGCVILAPHLTQLTKREVGLPHYDRATERQRREGMCWQDEDELYNKGQAFKLTCRSDAGVIVTLIADNYFGYCKKEVKTQISFSANLLGDVEEEHAGGALAFASFNLGDEFQANSRRYNGRTFADLARDYSEWIDIHPEGYGVDRHYSQLIYIPEDAHATLGDQKIYWMAHGQRQSIPLLPGRIYMAPSGYRLQMDKHPAAPTWRLIGTAGEGASCHKPCTVSGGGKSEISKSLVDYMLYGPIFVADLKHDLDLVQQIFDKDYSTRWRPGSSVVPDYQQKPSRAALDPRRSLGSLIKLLTPSHDYTDEYNNWLASIPNYVYSLAFIIKRFQDPTWDSNWRQYFTVDIVNGVPGHELKYRNRKLVGSYLRVGFDEQGNWRTFKLRQDFAPAAKVQTQDDISASVVVPKTALNYLNPSQRAMSYKFVENCERRLFQRPDDAVHRGLDEQTEADLARRDNFIANFEPLPAAEIRQVVEYVVDFAEYTQPMQQLLSEVAADGEGYVVSSSRPRMVDGKPTKNPRYLQLRPDLARPLDRYVAEMGTRLYRAIPASQPVPLPVNSVLFGRRNNPAEPSHRIRGLAVYNPLHFQELPELFMDFICSLTGKSPSTTGAGSEGALTKGPFNAVLPIIDLNNALVSFLLTELVGFSTAAGHIGPRMRVDHDVSYLIPEIWCRLSPDERDPQRLIAEGLFEPLEDYDYQGERILASRLGYRMTERFVRAFFGRIFDNPAQVFEETILRPELQDAAAFADGIKYICEAHTRVAKQYFLDGSIELACPPLKAILEIMAEGHSAGRDARHPDIRAMFTLPSLLQSDWYQQRLDCKHESDVRHWQEQANYLQRFLDDKIHQRAARRLQLKNQLDLVTRKLSDLATPAARQARLGTLGLDPSLLHR